MTGVCPLCHDSVDDVDLHLEKSLPVTRNVPPGTMTLEEGVWIYQDTHGSLWKVKPTGDPFTPLVIEVYRRRQ